MNTPSSSSSPTRGQGQAPSHPPASGHLDDHFRAGGSGGGRQLLDTAEYGLEYGQRRYAGQGQGQEESYPPYPGQEYPSANQGQHYPLTYQAHGRDPYEPTSHGHGEPQQQQQQQQYDNHYQHQQQQQYQYPHRPHLQPYEDPYNPSSTRNSSSGASGSNSTSASTSFNTSTPVSFTSKRAEAATFQWGKRFWYASDESGGDGGDGGGGGGGGGRESEEARTSRSEHRHELRDELEGGNFGSGFGGGGGGGGESGSGSRTGRANAHPDTGGKVLRFAVEIVQQPLHSRAFNDSRDRRPLVHPPIIRLRVVRCEPKEGMGGLLALVKDWENLMEDDSLWDDRFDELDADILSLDPSGLVCTLDLISYRDVEQQSSSSASSVAPYRLANRIPISWTTNTGSRTGPRRGSTSQASLRGSATIRAAEKAITASASVRRSLGLPEDVEQPGDIDAGGNPPRASSTGGRKGPGEGPESDGANKRRKITTQSAGGTPAGQYSSVLGSDRGGQDDDQVDMQQVDSEPREETTKNLYGALHIGGRRMFGPRLDDRDGSGQGVSTDRKDLGIWFIFTDVSIRTQGEYAIRFRCSDLNSARSSPSPPSHYFTSRLPDPSVAARELLALGVSVGHDIAMYGLDDERPESHPTGSRRPSETIAGGGNLLGDLPHRIAHAVPEGLGNIIAHVLPNSMTAGLPDGLGIEHAIRSETQSDSPGQDSDHDDSRMTGQDDQDSGNPQSPLRTPPPKAPAKLPRAPFLGEAFSRSFKVFYGRSCPPVPSQTKLTEHFTR